MVSYFLTTRGVYTFQQMQETYEAPDQERYRYIQIRNFLDLLVGNYDRSRPSSGFKTRCRTHPTTQGLVLLLYSSLLGASNTSTPSYCARWEADFGGTL